VNIRKIQADSAAPAAANIGNWQEGADLFAQAFKGMLNAGGNGSEPGGGMPDAPQNPPKNPAPKPTHSPDFTSVDWFGARYAFAKGNQAESVRVLWDAWEGGGHSLSQETIADRIGSNANRFQLAKVFRRRKPGGGYEPHPAWGTMIQRDSKGSCRLAPPESS
jgi:hypothetical protein